MPLSTHYRIVILASGNGSNFEAIVRWFRKNQYPVEIVYLITENPDAFAIKRAERLKVPVKIIDFKAFKKRDEFNRKLFEFLNMQKPLDLIVLAGFMKILPEFIVKAFWRKMINIHPSLLPAFKGLNAIERAYKSGVKYTGITIHFVEKEVDAGRIIEQRAIRIRENETLESLTRRIHRLEHYWYPRIIWRLLTNDIEALK